MTITITQSYSAVAANGTSSFLATGGRAPYTYSVLAGGAGGAIVARTGIYTAPVLASSSPNNAYDTVQVTDALAVTATASILVGTPLILFCDIIQQGLGLANGRCYLWDQKIFQPSDYDLYVAVSVPSEKVFGNTTVTATNAQGIFMQFQSVNARATLDINIMSRGPAARDRKEEVLMALSSIYSEQQQEANNFFIGKISTNFVNLSNIDGAAIPYRYAITAQMLFSTIKASPVSYYNQFSIPAVTTN